MAGYDFENLIIGSGEAGKYLAWTLAHQGQSTAVVERRYFGGSCPNIACLPSKNLVHSAHVASLVARQAEFGLVGAPAMVDMAAVQHRKRGMVAGLLTLHEEKFRGSGAAVIWGEARFTGPRTVRVALREGGERTVSAARVFVNVGSRAAIPAVPGLREADPLTHIEALDLETLPGHLVIIGGGYVAVELAQAFRRFGGAVTMLVRGDRVVPQEDPEFSAAMLALLTEEGVAVRLKTEAARVEGRSGDAVRVHLAGGAEVLAGTHLLAAAGRVPNTAGLGLEAAGVELTRAGHIRVNERLETTTPAVWAMGECAGSPYFTHASYDDFRVVRANLAGQARSTAGRLIPSCVFTDPALARVGMTETEARRQGIAYRIATLPLAAVLRTRTISEPRGLMKAVVEAATGRILGFAAFGAEAAELMAAMQVAMVAGLPFGRLSEAVFAHPAMAEGLTFLTESGLRDPR